MHTVCRDSCLSKIKFSCALINVCWADVRSMIFQKWPLLRHMALPQCQPMLLQPASGAFSISTLFRSDRRSTYTTRTTLILIYCSQRCRTTYTRSKSRQLSWTMGNKEHGRRCIFGNHWIRLVWKQNDNVTLTSASLVAGIATSRYDLCSSGRKVRPCVLSRVLQIESDMVVSNECQFHWGGSVQFFIRFCMTCLLHQKQRSGYGTRTRDHINITETLGLLTKVGSLGLRPMGANRPCAVYAGK